MFQQVDSYTFRKNFYTDINMTITLEKFICVTSGAAIAVNECEEVTCKPHDYLIGENQV